MRSSNLNNFTVKKFGSLSNLKLFDRKEDYKSPDDRTLRTELFPIVFLFFFLSFSIVIDRLRSVILLREKRSNFLRVYFSSKRCKKNEKERKKKGSIKNTLKRRNYYSFAFARKTDWRIFVVSLGKERKKSTSNTIDLAIFATCAVLKGRAISAWKWKGLEGSRKAYISTRIA